MDYVERFLKARAQRQGKRLKVGLFGLGRTNLALAKRLKPLVQSITVRSDSTPDSSLLSQINPERVLIKERSLADIDEDVLLLSPSVRRDKAELLLARGTLLFSDCELFFSYRDTSTPLFAVSGSDGKSTVTYLSSLMLKHSGIKSEAVCNFGLPFCEMGECTPVAELSSFNLQYLDGECDRATVTTITPNHLDWHSSFEEYRNCKLKLINMSREFVYNLDCPVIRNVLSKEKEVYAIISQKYDYQELRKVSRANLYYTLENGFIKRNGEKFISACDLKRSEAHNVINFMNAAALTDGYADREAILGVGRSFEGLAHRCQSLGVIQGVEYIDSSIDTSPDRTARTLSSLDRRVIIILGGRGKGLPFDALFPMLKKYVSFAALYGALGKELVAACNTLGINFTYTNDFTSAVKNAISTANTGDTVLLSPAGTAYDQFKNYEHRADAFRLLLNK